MKEEEKGGSCGHVYLLVLHFFARFFLNSVDTKKLVQTSLSRKFFLLSASMARKRPGRKVGGAGTKGKERKTATLNRTTIDN